jgi:hypothetical protein
MDKIADCRRNTEDLIWIKTRDNKLNIRNM